MGLVVDRISDRVEAHNVGSELGIGHATKQMQCQLPLLALEGLMPAYKVRTSECNFALSMPPKKRRPPLAFLAGADGGIVAGHIRAKLCFEHAGNKVQCQLPLLALLAGADGGAVADDIWVNFGIGHVIKQMQCELPLLAVLAAADNGAVADNI